LVLPSGEAPDQILALFLVLAFGLFERRSCCVAQVGLKLKVFLPQSQILVLIREFGQAGLATLGHSGHHHLSFPDFSPRSGGKTRRESFLGLRGTRKSRFLCLAWVQWAKNGMDCG
jgi:hypothetical protein